MCRSWVAMTIVVPVRLIRSSRPHDLEADARVEVPGGLVGEQDRRLVDDGAGDRHALLLATGQLVREPLLLALEPDGRAASRAPSGGSRERDLPMTCSAKATFWKTVLLGSSRKSWNTVPISRRSCGTLRSGSRDSSRPATKTDPDVAFSSLQREAQEGGLAGAGLADDEDELATLDLERHAVDGGPRGPRVLLRHGVEQDHVSVGLRLSVGTLVGHPRGLSRMRTSLGA